MGLAATNHAGKGKSAAFLTSGLVFCAFLLAPPAARADDSLWGKAMSTIGLGGASSSGPNSANPQQATPTPAPTSAPQPTPAAPASQPLPDVNVNASAHPAQSGNQNPLTNWFGWGRHNDASVGAPAPPAVEPQGKAINPVPSPAAPTPAAPTPAAPSGGPSMWDKMLGSVGLETRNPMDNINYSERPKLAVPKDRGLPQPGSGGEPVATRPANTDALIKPPGDYLEKVRGADGKVSGLREGDTGKEKKFFGLF